MTPLRFITCVAGLGLAMLGAAVACSSFAADGEEPGQADSSADGPAGNEGSLDGAPGDGSAVRRHLYAYGGVANAYRAEVLGDGGLGTWERYAALDMQRTAFASAALPGAVLAAGGQGIAGAPAYDSAVERAAFDDGGIAPWQASAPLPAGRYSPQGAASRDFVYVSGGLVPGSVPTSEILSASVAPGSISPWAVAGQLPAPAAAHSTIVHGGRLYLVAAAGGTTPTWSASLFPDGGLGDWTSLAKIPAPVLESAIVTVGQRIFLLGTRNANNGPEATVWQGGIDGAGTILGWSPSTPLPTRRSGVCAVVDGDVIYVLGGQVDGTEQANVVAAGRVEPSGAVLWSPLSPMPEARSHFGCALR